MRKKNTIPKTEPVSELLTVFNRIIKKRHVKKFSIGQKIFNENTKAESVYLVKKGYVKMFTNDNMVKKNLITVAGEGEFVGLNDILNDKKKKLYSYSVECLSDVETAKFTSDEFFKLSEKNTRLKMVLMKYLCGRIEIIENHLRHQEIRNHKERLTRILAELSKSNTHPLKLRLSIDDMCSLSGIGKVSILKVINELSKKGLISSISRFVTEINPKKFTSSTAV